MKQNPLYALYTKGKTITSLDLYKPSAKKKLKEIAVLEEYIGIEKDQGRQMIAMNRMNLLIKEIHAL